MADVAREAGVSMITVSRMLREPELVAEATRTRIEEAMDVLGYVPNRVAGGLAGTQTQVVAALVPYIHHGVFADAIQGLSDVLNRHGYSVLLGTADGGEEEEYKILRTLLGYRPAGVVLQGANHSEATRRLMERAQIPVVEMGTIPPDPIDMYVGYSNRAAAEAMTERLIRAGRRRIGIITADPASNDRNAERLAGFQAALGRAGIPFDSSLSLHLRYGIAEGREALVTLLERYPDMDALFCASDLWAAGAIYECQRRRIPVPEQIAVCGFNDQEFAAEMVPSITTVRVRRYEIGVLSGESILARLKGQPVERAVDVGFEIVERESG